MPVYRDKERKSWYVSCIYRDFKGERKHKTKRGFKTKPEAARWEIEFTAKAGRNTHMLFRDFVDYYEQDRRPRLRENTWLTKKKIQETRNERGRGFAFFSWHASALWMQRRA